MPGHSHITVIEHRMRPVLARQAVIGPPLVTEIAPIFEAGERRKIFMKAQGAVILIDLMPTMTESPARLCASLSVEHVGFAE